MPVGHSATGAVRDGGDQVAFIPEGEGAGLGGDAGKMVAIIGQRGHGAIRFRHAHTMPRRVEFDVLSLFIGQDVAAARLGELPQVAGVGQPGAVLFGKFHVAAAGQVDGDLIMEYIHLIVVVVAPAVAQTRRVLFTLAGIVAAHEGHLFVAFQRQVGVRPVQAAGDHIHRVARHAARNGAIAGQHAGGQLDRAGRHGPHLGRGQRAVGVAAHDLTLAVIRQREGDRLHQAAGKADNRDHIVAGRHVADIVRANTDAPVPRDKVIDRGCIIVDGVHQHRRPRIEIFIEFPVDPDAHLEGKRRDLVRGHDRHDLIRVSVFLLDHRRDLFRREFLCGLRRRHFRRRLRRFRRFRGLRGLRRRCCFRGFRGFRGLRRFRGLRGDRGLCRHRRFFRRFRHVGTLRRRSGRFHIARFFAL